MLVLNNFIATGTQLKYERPGKSTAIAPCDTIEGPIIKLKNSDVVFLDSIDDAQKIVNEIEEIIFLGDILINYGEFFNRAHKLVPPGYCEEWWLQELKNAESNPEKLSKITNMDQLYFEELFKNPTKKISLDESITLSQKLKIPLHPRYTFHWKDISQKQFLSLAEWLDKGKIEKEKIILPMGSNVKEILEDADGKRVLELLGIPHKLINKEHVLIEKDWAKALMLSFGFLNKNLDIKKIINQVSEKDDILTTINKLSEIKLRDKSGTFIGARMGRPEKAKLRKLTGSPHILFPVGEEGGRLRSFQSALNAKRITGDFPIYYCNYCTNKTIYPICENCDKKTERKYYCNKCNKDIPQEICPRHGKSSTFEQQEIDINHYFEKALKMLKLKNPPSLIKGVRGTSNKDHVPENLAKGILRSVNELYVNKDGTIRYDMTEMPITHFKPKEIGTSIKRLKELGYINDIHGEILENEDQLLEIKPQDVILPNCSASQEEGADIILSRIANFIDDLLENFYKLKRFYNIKSKEDLIGHLIIGLAPHTSAGIIGRIIGFSKTQVCYAHPFWHSAQRRDCEGDEDCVMLLMDTLLNFSRHYLPTHRGSTQDATLVLTSKLIPSEVDDMVFDLDIVWEYPLSFYEAALNYKNPWDIKLEQIDDRLSTDKQYTGFGFTNNVEDINMGAKCSAYKSLPTMMDKVRGQMLLANKIRAVDENDVAKLVIERHFLRDIKGNLRKFSMQEFRCVACNAKYRRPFLNEGCLKCGGRLIFTVSEGSVIKYLQPSIELANKYNLSPYLKQTLELTKHSIESVFGKESERQEGLGKWFS